MPYIGKSPSAGVRQRYQYTATAGQTTFSGTDLGNLTLTYTDNNFVDVFQNGVLLKGGGTDYTATSGTSVVLATGASVSDVIEIIVYDVFSVGNFYSRTDSDSRYLNVAGDTMSGALDLNGQELVLDADADTSITADTDDRIDIKVAGSDVVHVDSGGRVGIGTNSPSGYDGEANNLVIYEAGSSGHAGITIANDGNDARGHILFADGTSGSQAYQGAVSYDHSANALYFRTGGTERARINSDGHFRVGTHTHSGGYMINCASPNMGSTYGGISIQNLADADNGYYLGFYKSNNTLLGKVVQNSSSVSYDTTSDYRLKENVVTDWDATTRLKQLKPSRFNFKGYKDETVDGFLAHEVSSIVPQAISGEKDAVDKDGNPEYQGIDHSKLVPLLTKALQESIARADALEARIKKLEDG